MAIQDRNYTKVGIADKARAAEDRGHKRQGMQRETAQVEHHTSHYLAFLLRYFEPFAGRIS
jgi:hypothetical protein